MSAQAAGHTTADTSKEPAGAPPACGLLFVRLAQVARSRLRDSLERMGIGPQEFAVLHQLAHTGGETQLGLARALRIHPSNLVAVLDALEEAGLLARVRDPADRRRHLVGLTAAGKRALAKADAVAQATERELLAPLGASERAQLHTYLIRLSSHACGK
jgi:DNA-binding MarR family transcriptional regulator